MIFNQLDLEYLVQVRLALFFNRHITDCFKIRNFVSDIVLFSASWNTNSITDLLQSFPIIFKVVEADTLIIFAITINNRSTSIPSERNKVSLVWRWRHFQIWSIFSYYLNLFLFFCFLTSATATRPQKSITSSTFIYTHDRSNKTSKSKTKQLISNSMVRRNYFLCCAMKDKMGKSSISSP